jgi:hypothetical protein
VHKLVLNVFSTILDQSLGDSFSAFMRVKNLSSGTKPEKAFYNCPDVIRGQNPEKVFYAFLWCQWHLPGDPNIPSYENKVVALDLAWLTRWERLFLFWFLQNCLECVHQNVLPSPLAYYQCKVMKIRNYIRNCVLPGNDFLAEDTMGCSVLALVLEIPSAS